MGKKTGSKTFICFSKLKNHWKNLLGLFSPELSICSVLNQGPDIKTWVKKLELEYSPVPTTCYIYFQLRKKGQTEPVIIGSEDTDFIVLVFCTAFEIE